MDTTASMVDAMVDAGLTGRQVAIQLHGFTDDVQLARLRELSAAVLTVTPYRWTHPPVRDRLPRLIKAACARQLDAVTFTSAPAARRADGGRRSRPPVRPHRRDAPTTWPRSRSAR